MPETVRRMGEYAIEEICPSVYAIDTDGDESLYLVCGQEKALLIDTGSSVQPLGPVIDSLWREGPVELALTHAHFDHMYHADAYATVYWHEKETAAWNRVLRPVVWISTRGVGKQPKRYPVKSWHTLKEGDTISLGGKDLRVLDAPGHTPGSMILVDEADRLVFTGDAFGSGSYAWMWMPGCCRLSEYQQALDRLIPKLEPYEDYRMVGGHRRQGAPSEQDPDARPLTLDTARAMRDLCGKILNGECPAGKIEQNFGFKTTLYSDGAAAMVLRGSKLK